MTDREQLAAVFRALGNPTRLNLVAEIARVEAAESDERSALGLTELARRVEISRFSAGFHLEQLREARLVVRSRVGRRAVHTLGGEAMDAIDLWLCETTPLNMGEFLGVESRLRTRFGNPT